MLIVWQSWFVSNVHKKENDKLWIIKVIIFILKMNKKISNKISYEQYFYKEKYN